MWNYSYVRQPNWVCPYRNCPYRVKNDSNDVYHEFIFFPELTVETSLSMLFPELYFYP